jgi:hypothetical protein
MTNLGDSYDAKILESKTKVEMEKQATLQAFVFALCAMGVFTIGTRACNESNSSKADLCNKMQRSSVISDPAKAEIAKFCADPSER